MASSRIHPLHVMAELFLHCFALSPATSPQPEQCTTSISSPAFPLSLASDAAMVQENKTMCAARLLFSLSDPLFRSLRH